MPESDHPLLSRFVTEVGVPEEAALPVVEKEIEEAEEVEGVEEE